MNKPTKCIPVTEARTLQDNWVNTRATDLERDLGYVDTREFVYSVAELEELIRTRCMVEQTALRESVQSGDAKWEERVVLTFHRLSRLEETADGPEQHRTPEWEAAHREYHIALLSACGSNILLDFCRQLHEQTLRYRSLVEVVEYRDIHECSEHRDIQEAVLDRDVERAVSMLHAHYSVTLEIIKSSGALA